ncbi:hypothetical protein D9758_016503 [Tetrapyrgos nigripes]|uniref:F-box domain-containing protein n=1 Tax=Tetrapyrgos nigripes TaxID=182062 RepID=A0A8H5CLV3_9AGAR|nr:hypothetical protein D9758_016503 [Tetrapyrgos nigripes]
MNTPGGGTSNGRCRPLSSAILNALSVGERQRCSGYSLHTDIFLFILGIANHWQREPPFKPRVPEIISPLRPRVPEFDPQFLWYHVQSQTFPLTPPRDQLLWILKDAENDLCDYEEDLQWLEAIVVELRGKRDELRKYIDSCKACLSPIRLLPVEIIAKISMWYQNAHMHGSGRRDFREPLSKSRDESTEVMTALVLGSVCRLWREIAFSTPSLWAQFSLVLTENCEAQQRLLDIYLSRSKEYPLSFHLNVNHQRGNSIIIALLVNQSHRWFSTSWLFLHDEYMSSLGLGARMDLPHLRYIERSFGRVSEEHASCVFAGTKALQTVSFRGMSRFLHSKLCWDQIHCLSIQDFCPGSDFGPSIPVGSLSTLVWHLAQICPILRSLELDIGENYPLVPADGTRGIYLGMLENLCLEEMRWYEVHKLFSVSTFPNLRRVSVLLDTLYAEHEGDPDMNATALSFFISRSGCSITVLRLERLCQNGVDIACNMLRHIPTLNDLIIREDPYRHNPSVMTTVIETLDISGHPVETLSSAGEEQSDLILPILRRLIMEVNADYFEASGFAGMVKSRAVWGSLESARLYLQWSSSTVEGSVTLLQYLKSLQGSGMEIISSTSTIRRYLKDDFPCWP